MLHCDCDAKYVLFEACNATVNLEKREIEEVLLRQISKNRENSNTMIPGSEKKANLEIAYLLRQWRF